jgi:hypothetical protein
MQITRFKIQYLPTAMLILVGVLVWMLSCGDVARAESYTASAHGKKVNRSGTGYPQGDCAHCHDTFDDSICGVNELMLFATQFTNQRGGLCMRCHSSGPYCEQDGGFIINFDYSRTWGGQTTKDCPDNIRMAFKFINHDTRLPQTNCDLTEPIGSAHDLQNIKSSALMDKWGFLSGTGINPCLGCHNPHQATKEYPCSKPSGHENVNTWEVWGDESGEKMADYLDTGEIYQPPYKVGWTPEEPKYERDADTQPNYVELCLECHQYSQNSLQHGTVTAIDWENADMGKEAAYRDWSPLKLPYDNLGSFGKYVLCCTDCHEPHGSRNEWLLRTEVNGTIVEINEARNWLDFCMACHEVPHNWVNLPETGDSRANCYGGEGLDACHQHFRAGYGF